MSNFTVNFLYPWCLLLFIPAIALSLWPYLRTPKRYRRTRNRITSLVLHLCIMTFSILALSGLTFSYDKNNTENELILLVDASFSNAASEDRKNEFVRTVIDESERSNKVGVVTFGFDQVYAVELTNDTDSAYRAYLDAPRPDTSASDIASALAYTRELFSNPSTAKIVLLSDGAETDGNAVSAIRTVAAMGIRVDTVYFPNTYTNNEMQISNVALPDSDIMVNDEFSITVTVQSSYTGPAKLSFYDNDELIATKDAEITEGAQNVLFEKCVFRIPGLHRMRFEIEADGDTLKENNAYYSYYYIETFDKILIVAKDPAEAANFKKLLDDAELDVTLVNVQDTMELPMTVDAIREYDEVVMFNIANADMPEGFINVLHTYVSELGGGMFTVGGNKIDEYGDTVPNAYNRKDMYGTLYQQMLPVEVINYTPPLGLMIIIDRSGSMGTGEGSLLEEAKSGARSALYTLSERDLVGIMTLESTYEVAQNLISATNQNRLINIIESIGGGGGTDYGTSIGFAGKALAAQTSIQNRHIILISDGQPGDSYAKYSEQIKNNYANGITFSMFNMGSGSSNETELRQAAEEDGHGMYWSKYNSNLSLSDALRQDLTVDEIKEYVPEQFIPNIGSPNSVVSGITDSMLNPPLDENGEPTGIPVVLGGFYGTKVKNVNNDTLVTPLWTKFSPQGNSSQLQSTPLYTQWQYGAGKVGCFMSDLMGTAGSWSESFMEHDIGKKLIINMINSLFPKESVRYRDFNVTVEDDNYTTKISVTTTMDEGDNITVEMQGPLTGEDAVADKQTITRTDKEEYTRYSIVNKRPGIYALKVEKVTAQGKTITYTTYKTFSYSKEYDMFIDESVCAKLMEDIYTIGRGAAVSDPLEVFEGFVEKLNVVIDPRMVFMILSIILFLLDIAVRKFKWKWLHEIIRERKEKNQQNIA